MKTAFLATVFAAAAMISAHPAHAQQLMCGIYNEAGAPVTGAPIPVPNGRPQICQAIAASTAAYRHDRQHYSFRTICNVSRRSGYTIIGAKNDDSPGNLPDVCR